MEKKGLMVEQNKKMNGSIKSIFMHLDGDDWLLMIFRFIGAMGAGISMPAMFIVTSKLSNNIGGGTNSYNFIYNINKKALLLFYMASAQWVACFLEGNCWARIAEIQASRLRVRYLKAILRQDFGYFHLHVTSTAEVIASVSSDSLVIQDVISEKVSISM